MSSPDYNATKEHYEQNSCYIDDDHVAQCTHPSTRRLRVSLVADPLE